MGPKATKPLLGVLEKLISNSFVCTTSNYGALLLSGQSLSDNQANLL